MKTTVTIDADAVRELAEHYGERTKTAAVNRAIEEQLRAMRLKKLASLLGKIKTDPGGLQESEAADLMRADWLEDRGAAE